MKSTEGLHRETWGMSAGCKSEAILPSKAQWWEAFLSIQALSCQPHPSVFLPPPVVPFWSPSCPPR